MVTIHAGCMLAGFLSMAAGITIAMFMRKRKWWLRVHRRLGSAGVACVLLGFVAALFMVSRWTGHHFAVPHAHMGLVTILSVLFTYAMGIMQFKVKKKAAKIQLIHRWSGRLTLTMLFLNIISGLFLGGIV